MRIENPSKQSQAYGSDWLSRWRTLELLYGMFTHCSVLQTLTVCARVDPAIADQPKRRILSTGGSFWRVINREFMTQKFFTSDHPLTRKMGDLLFTSLNRQKWFFGPAVHEVGGTKKLFYDFWLVPKGSTHTAKIFWKFSKFWILQPKNGVFGAIFGAM